MGYLQSAEEALAAENWRNAAELFSKAINELRENLAAGPDVDGLVEAYSGRGQALAEMGRQRGTLPRQPATLKAALADARAAAALAARGAGGIGPVRAVKALQSTLQETGQNLEEAQAAARALLDGPAARASRKVHQELQQLAQGADTSRLCAEMDAAADDGWSPGTFRWPSRMTLPELPAGKPAAAGLSDKGWGPYLRSRGGEEMVRAARAKAIMLDALSFPLSLAWILSQESVVQWPKEPRPPDWELHVVVLGATSKAEVRVWRDSKYWDELAELLKHRCNVRLHFVGPEISRSSGFSDLSEVHQVEPPCAKHFFQQRPDLRPENTVCAVFNGGYGNFVASGRDELFWSWLPDLLFLAESRYLCAFFCANDYADLRGEIAIHTAILGSCFVLSPRENPFAMATVYSGEDNSGEWFSGNAFTFVTCGYQRRGLKLTGRHAATQLQCPGLNHGFLECLADADECEIVSMILAFALRSMAMEAEGSESDDLVYSGPDFPEELDEFLAYGVREHDGDFEAISEDFLEIAQGLDEELVERAYEFYSPEALRRRWRFLTALESEPVTGASASSSASSADMPGPRLGDVRDQTDPMEMPHLSFFSEDVRDQIKAIYDDVQAKLPSSYLDQAEDDEDVLCENSDSIAPEMSVSGKSGSGAVDGEGVADADDQDAGTDDGDVSDCDSELSDSMEDTAVSLFGTADLNEILAYLSRPEVDALQIAVEALTPVKKPVARAHDTVPSDGESEQAYQARRRALKDSSKRLVRNSFGAEQDQKRQMRSPPEPRCEVKSVSASQISGTVRALQQLVDPNDSEAETDAAETESNASEDADYEEDQDVRIRTMLQLLRQAPNGDCPWDVWLEATRAWPQLKIRLDDPGICRRRQGLRVEFSVDKLKSALEEERAERFVRNEKRKERRSKNGVVELVREAERRRDMMSGRWDFKDLMLVST
ncbi:unnamed protein product [Symbiodinium sp. CCMP2456]|nr:unnamed protein product [Symbiodinium sp. CCMP2456]